MRTVIIFFLLCSSVYAVDMNIIAEIESGNNPRAYNNRTQATGKYQITPICLRDYLQYHPQSTLTMQDMFDAEKSLIVADWYINVRIPQLLRHYGFEATDENIVKAYNAGHTYITQSKRYHETEHYWIKYQRRMV